jgi:TrmH family RNA methyltransferase
MSESAARDDTGRWREIRSELQRLDVETVIAPDDVLAELTGGRKNGPVVGIVSRPEPVSMAGLMANTAANSTAGATKCLPLFLVADNVEDPGNVGAMIRTALAAGATGFAAVGISDPFHPRAVRTSMGSLFRIPVQCFASAKEAIDYFHAAGLEAVGAVSTAGVPLTELHFRPKQKGRAIFLGSEAFGLGEGTLERLDWMVTIPMASEVDSYSVNAAAAILMHKFAGEER